jgi:hypothetical protein
MTGLKSTLDRYPTGRMMVWLIAVVFFGSIAVCMESNMRIIAIE